MNKPLIGYLALTLLLSLLAWGAGWLLGWRQSWLRTLVAAFFGLVIAGNIVYVIAIRDPAETDYTWLVVTLDVICTLSIVTILHIHSRSNR